ncbi:MAG: ABC transporter permease subunit [Polyangiaceae bacterium]|nr:ABC transporter permease subunit [Myxococcales bacterium]MCB9588661.1 ABC transporter permease subunit [Polyangiaceae bacterium]MCB9605219.1 ABC transporter permease subunit [Polyangiaceae bacterium]
MRFQVALLLLGLGLALSAAGSVLSASPGLFQLCLVGVSVAIFGAALGVALALSAAFGPRAVDRLLARGVEASAALPTVIFLALMLIAQPGLGSTLVLLALLRALRVARPLRAELLRMQTLDWALASRALGASTWRQFLYGYLPALLELLALELGSGVLWTLGVVFATCYMRPDLLPQGVLLFDAASGVAPLGWAGAALLGAGSLGLVFPGRRKRGGGGAPAQQPSPTRSA